MVTIDDLTEEQKEVLHQVSLGNNVLVDACIGSGKTTVIQMLCSAFQNKQILYLTYSKLLKFDAISKIRSYNAKVASFHGFAWKVLNDLDIKAGKSDSIQIFNKKKPKIQHYDMLILDEYQDIDLEISEMLKYIKFCNPNIQIVAVGDMKQKIYDKTNLNIRKFIDEFLGKHKILNFTYCFRICSALAKKLGRIWEKKIVGVNKNCKIETMNLKEIAEFLAKQNLADILCLGARKGEMSRLLNNLEEQYPEKFNKKTVYASIRDDGEGATQPSEKTAIFTTFDGSKGLERKICVIFNYTEEYWYKRIENPMTKYEIMRNIFCVAASRGKERIIFVKDNDAPLSERTLSTPTEENMTFDNFYISDMFDFKYKEDIEECYQALKIEKIPVADNSEINIKTNDELIDLSPCIGNYQEAVFFKNYDIDEAIKVSMVNNLDLAINNSWECINILNGDSLEDKILLLTALEASHDRYIKQVEKPIVSDSQKLALTKRLNTVFTSSEMVQVKNSICVMNEEQKTLFWIKGRCDVLTIDFVYELKFVSELQHIHYLQLACYLVALDKEKGRLWNTKKNEMYEITIPDKTAFMQKVIKTITKGRVKKCVIALE